MEATHSAQERRALNVFEANKIITRGTPLDDSAAAPPPVGRGQPARPGQRGKAAITFSTRTIAHALLIHADAYGNVKASTKEIATFLVCAQRTVQLALNELIEKQWIEREDGRIRLRSDGPLASAWSRVGDRSGIHAVAGATSDILKWTGDPLIGGAPTIRGLEVLRSARMLHRPRTSSRFDARHADAVAEWFTDLVHSLALDTPELSADVITDRTARWVMDLWMKRPGNIDPRAPQGFNRKSGWSLRWFHVEMEELSADVLREHERRRAPQAPRLEEQLAGGRRDLEEARRLADQALGQHLLAPREALPRRRAAGGAP